MTVAGDWYNGIVRKVGSLKNDLSPVDSWRSKLLENTAATQLEPLLTLARRIDEFASDCTQCQIFRDDIDKLMTNAPETVQQGDEGLVQLFLKDVSQIGRKISRHHQKEHKLVNGGYYSLIFFFLGGFVGIAGSLVTSYILHGSWDDLFFRWMFIGMFVGLAIGAFLDYRAKKENRILFETAYGGYSRSRPILIIILLILIVIALLTIIILLALILIDLLNRWFVFYYLPF